MTSPASGRLESPGASGGHKCLLQGDRCLQRPPWALALKPGPALSLCTCSASSESFKQGTGVSECLETGRVQNSTVKRAIVGLGLGLLPQVPSEACFHTERGAWSLGTTALLGHVSLWRGGDRHCAFPGRGTWCRLGSCCPELKERRRPWLVAATPVCWQPSSCLQFKARL